MVYIKRNDGNREKKMLAKLQDFMGIAMLHSGALIVSWALLIIASYGMAHWCFKSEISWRKIITWISIAMALVLTVVMTLDFLPDEISDPFRKVIVPYLICSVVLHSFLLAVDKYMCHKYNERIIQTRLVVAVIAVYGLFLGAGCLVLKVGPGTFMTLTDIGVGYLTRIGIVGLLVFEVMGGRCNCKNTIENNSESEESDSYTSRW